MNYTEAFIVESGIPLPRHAALGGRRRYDWQSMAVGDSLFIPRQGEEPWDNVKGRIHASLRSFKLRSSWQFTARKRTLERDGEEGYRVWRTN